jgi:hypothetical protein
MFCIIFIKACACTDAAAMSISGRHAQGQEGSGEATQGSCHVGVFAFAKGPVRLSVPLRSGAHGENGQLGRKFFGVPELYRNRCSK